jgi:hypothetical protein
VGHLAVQASRLVLMIVFAGTLVVQGFLVPLAALDFSDVPDPAWDDLQLPVRAVVFLTLVVLVVVAAQVVMVCLWRLLTMVRRDTVFSSRAFRPVDVIIGAVGTASVLVFAIACTLAPGEGVAPGVVLLVCVVSAALAGAGLLVFVLRTLLAKAVARDAEAYQLRAELDEVI